LVGVTALQLTSKRANFEAVQRSTAAMLGQDIIERMRTNQDQLAVYTNFGAGRTLDGTTMANVDCSAGCTADQIAALDLYYLEQALIGVAEKRGTTNTGGLSQPIACITGPNGGSGIYTVAIAWRGMTALSNPTADTCGETSGL
jgi:type IV pilus assembly protein PilV